MKRVSMIMLLGWIPFVLLQGCSLKGIFFGEQNESVEADYNQTALLDPSIEVVEVITID